MAFNFPSSPSLNDTYTFGNRTWTWNGSAWQLNSTAFNGIDGIPIGSVTPSTGAFTTVTTSGNITAGGILTDNYFYANGDPFVASGGGSNYTDANVKTYLASFDGNIVPAANVTYYLGSETQQWHSLYVGPGSLYVNGKKVLEDDSGKITVSTSVNQNLAVKTSGTGDIELFVDGTGVINFQSNVQIDSGVSIQGVGGVKFSSNINLDQNHINNLDNPISPQDAATKSYVDTEISNLVNSAPAALDTLNELAAALGDDANFSTTVTNLIGNNSSNIAVLQGNVAAIESDIAAVESDVTVLQSNITAVESDITAVESDVTALQGNVTAAESDIATLQSNIAAVESDVTAINSQISGLNYYDNSNVAAFLGDIGSNAISTTGNITAGYFIGDGSQLTGVVSSYTDSNVQSLLSGDVTIGNITVTGSITGYATTSYVDNELAELVASAPSTLDTLNELAAALGDDANFATTVTNSIGNVASNVSVLQGNVTAIETDVAALQSDVAVIQGNITAVESDVATLQSNVTAIESDVGVLQSNVTAIESSLEAINDTPVGNVTPSTGAFTTLTSTGNTILGPVAGHFVPAANGTYDLGSATNRWNTLYLMGNTIDLGGATIKSDANEGTIALIPQLKAGESATTAIVIGQQGVGTVETDSSGEISAQAIQEAASNPNIITGNLTVNFNANVAGNIVTGSIYTDNYFTAAGEPFGSAVGQYDGGGPGSTYGGINPLNAGGVE